MFVGKFQRAASSPCVQVIKEINKLLKWICRKCFYVRYAQLQIDCGLIGIADSACRANDKDCLALRAAIIANIEVKDSKPGGFALNVEAVANGLSVDIATLKDMKKNAKRWKPFAMSESIQARIFFLVRNSGRRRSHYRTLASITSTCKIVAKNTAVAAEKQS